MKLIIGLGNPGVRYQRTRHNIGRALIEFMAAQAKAVFKREKKIASLRAETSWGAETVCLIYPEVFMNLSGDAVRKIKAQYPADPASDFLIVVDDAALPFGMLRLRGQGSSGGHNGLKSVAQALGSEKYARLRMGIGKPGTQMPADSEDVSEALHDYVLDLFSAAEEAVMPEFLKRAGDVCRLWAEGPMERAMNAVNQRVPKS